MDMPPDVDLLNEQTSEQVGHHSIGQMTSYDSVDPEFLAWAEEKGIDLDRDDAEALILAEYLRDLGAADGDKGFAFMFKSQWPTLNYALYKQSKESGLPPINPNSKYGFFSRANIQQEIDRINRIQREFLKNRSAQVGEQIVESEDSD